MAGTQQDECMNDHGNEKEGRDWRPGDAGTQGGGDHRVGSSPEPAPGMPQLHPQASNSTHATTRATTGGKTMRQRTDQARHAAHRHCERSRSTQPTGIVGGRAAHLERDVGRRLGDVADAVPVDGLNHGVGDHGAVARPAGGRVGVEVSTTG